MVSAIDRALKNAAPQESPSAGNHSGEDLLPAVAAPELAAKQAEQLSAFWAPVAETKLSPEAEAAADALCAKWAAMGLSR